MRLFGSKNHLRPGSGTSPGDTDAAGDGVVRVALQDLIGMSRYAERVPLPAVSQCASRSSQRLSGYQGRGMEFAESRLYQPGDDVRTLDWRVTARTGKAHTKLFREERERPVFLWVDDRPAMHFATRGSFKSVVAARMAALLAWSALQQGDRVGGQVFGQDRHIEFRPQWDRKALLKFLRHLAAPPPGPGSSAGSAGAIASALTRLRRQVRPGSLVFLLSDFRHFDDNAGAHLAHLARHSNLAMIFIHDPLESQLPPAGVYRLGNGSREITLDTGDRRTVSAYRQRCGERRAALAKMARHHGIHWLSCCTTDDPLQVLQRGLGVRPPGHPAGRKGPLP
jgi:uncharacterized protein (DUF58 family)